MAADEGEGQAEDEKSPAALAEEPAATEAEGAATKEARAPRTVSADHVRRALQEQAEDARLRVLGTRLRPHPPTPPAPAGGSGADEERDDALRRVVEDIASETARLREQADDLRSEVEKAAASLRERVEHAAERLVARATEDAQRDEAQAQEVDRLGEIVERATTSIGEVAGALAERGASSISQMDQHLGALLQGSTASIDQMDRQLGAVLEGTTASLNEVEQRLGALIQGTTASFSEVEQRLGALIEATTASVSEVEQRLGQLAEEVSRVSEGLGRLRISEELPAASPPAEGFGDFGGDLLKALEIVAEQLSGFSQRIEEVPDRVAERAQAAPGQDRTSEALSRLADEVARLRRRLPVRRTLAESTAKAEQDEPKG